MNLAKDPVNLHAAHEKTDSCAEHDVLLVYYLLACSTQNMAYMQHMKSDSLAAHTVSHASLD